MDYYGHRPILSFFDQENMSLYQSGGFHPVSLGDTFKDGRYIIRHKLGWGGFATVWLAKDTIREEWVAIKIPVARIDKEKSFKELSVLRELCAQSSRGGKAYVVELLDDFYLEGPNGHHHCLVLELLGPSLDSVIKSCSYVPFGKTVTSDDRLGSEVILRVSKQLLSTLVSLHDQGIAHGDISAYNIAFTASKVRHASEHDLFEILGTPIVEELVREDGQPRDPKFPKHIVRRAEWAEWVDEDEEDIRLIDWGESFRRGEEPDHVSQPADSRAPETIFTDRLDYRVDLWRTGLVLCHMIFGYKPFDAFVHQVKFLVPQMIHFVEDLPDEWKDKWLKMRDEPVESDDKEIVDQELREVKDLDTRFGGVLEDPEEPPLRPLLPIIRGLMRFRPSDRLTAAQALELLPPTP